MHLHVYLFACLAEGQLGPCVVAGLSCAKDTVSLQDKVQLGVICKLCKFV